jgi:hypothetical protein
MSPVKLNKLEEANYRANPTYELMLYDRLSHEDRAALADFSEDDEFYGFLVPRPGESLSVKSVWCDTALLWLTMRQPGRLPAYLRRHWDDECEHLIATLVFDGLLEIEMNDEFVWGAAAYDAVFSDPPVYSENGLLAQLSVAALQYAQALPMDPATLSGRLYYYNRVPASPRWTRRFPTTESVAQHWGLANHRTTTARLASDWHPVRLPPPNDGWFMWRSRRQRQLTQENGCTYKLYISPHCDHVQEAFRAGTAVLSECGALAFKVGKDLYGLLRPDKFVAYFQRETDLRVAAEKLNRTLAGCPVQGVPFTADLSGDGLLSWGIDPPQSEQTLPGQERESWRLWVTNRLATALTLAQLARNKAIEPWQFALARLRLDGVDITTWAPTESLWRTQTKRKE